ncbi:MAG: thiamine pyrophosphate-binding protein [Rhodospirillaceae bacterium]
MNRGKKIRDGGEYFVDVLAGLGVDMVISIPGAQTLSIWDAIGRRDDIRLVVPQSEWGGVDLAIRYGNEHGRPAVVINTVGPGCALELPGSYRAQQENVPVLFVTPAQPKFKRNFIEKVFLGLEQEKLLDPFVKVSRRVRQVSQMARAVRDVHAATMRKPAGPGRVWVEFPVLFGVVGEQSGNVIDTERDVLLSLRPLKSVSDE